MENDVAYFSRRASEEQEAASHAAHPNAKKAHLEMSGRYRDMADAIATSDPSLQPGEGDRSGTAPGA